MSSLIFSSLLQSIIISIITKSLEDAILLFCLLIVQKGLTTLFTFDGYLESIPLEIWRI